MSFMDIFKISEFKKEITRQQEVINKQSKLLLEIGAERYEDVTKKVIELESDFAKRVAEADEYNKKTQDFLDQSKNQINVLTMQIEAKTLESNDLDKKLQTTSNKIKKAKEIFKSMQYAQDVFANSANEVANAKQICTEIDEMIPSVFLHLHNMDVKSLNTAFKDNDKQIEKVMKSYESRYTTKTNQTIYRLMVIALRAELQNILYDLKYGKIDKAIEQIKEVIAKYMQIAIDGNQSIAPTITKFIGEMEYLFTNAAKIEYNYYVKKEQARQEQLAIRQQMREEAEERKLLEQEKKRMDQEESKYQQELAKVKDQLTTSTDEDTNELLQKRILELEGQLANITVEKEKITNLQHGMAGTVYIISNKGAFGENVFKIGMTRRIDPTERINELGSASVPFKYDIHSLIFSDDAVSFEAELHKRLNARRLNKVNLRKEFFKCNIDELEQIVNEVNPTAEFIKAMYAEEYNISINSEVNFDTNILQNEENDEDEIND